MRVQFDRDLFARAVAHVLAAEGITHRRFMAMSGVGSATLHRILNGESRSLEPLLSTAAALRLPFHLFLIDSGE